MSAHPRQPTSRPLDSVRDMLESWAYGAGKLDVWALTLALRDTYGPDGMTNYLARVTLDMLEAHDVP